MKLRLVKKDDAQDQSIIKESSTSTLGILNLESKYSSLEKNGLYVVSAPTHLMARTLIVETILNNSNNKTALLSFEDRSNVFKISTEKTINLMKIYRKGNLSLNFIYVEEYKEFFNKIKHDVAGKKFTDYDLIIIDIYQDIFLSMPEMELAFLLSSWQSWFLSQKKNCLWLIYGDHASEVLTTKFTKFNNLFNGLSILDYKNASIRYDILFWHLNTTVQANIALKLLLDENDQLTVDKYNFFYSQEFLMSPVTGQETTLVLRTPDVVNEIFPRKWKLVNDFEEIEQIIEHDSIATIIIYIDAQTQFTYVAHKVLELRKKGGRQLKIILREMEQCLRNSDEKFLVNLGANIVIPRSVDFLKFISMVYALQGSYYTRGIPNNPDEIDQINLNSYAKGALPIVDFISQTKELIDYAQKMEINSSLIKFQINESIPLDDIFNFINIKRNGDVYTHSRHHIYIFLYQCEYTAINNALSHLIVLPYEQLFLEHEFFTYSDEIRQELKLLEAELLSQSEDKNNEHLNTKKIIDEVDNSIRTVAKPSIIL